MKYFRIHIYLDLIKFLKGKGYRILDLNHFTIRNQIEMFAKAEVVISPTGSGLANIIFCKPGTKIIEIIPANHPNRKCERISKILGLKYFTIGLYLCGK